MNQTSFLSKGLHAFLGMILPAILVGLGVAGYYLSKAPEPDKVPALGSDLASLLSVMPAAQVEPVRALTDSLDIAASGVVVPYREIQLASEVGGRILEKQVSLRPGNHVRKGQVLLKIDPRDYQYEIDRLTQRLDQERAGLKESDQELQNTQRLLELSQSQLELSEADYKRTSSLESNFASQAELGASKQQMLTAMNQKVTLQNQSDSLRARRQRLELAIKLAETELRQAQLNLSRTEITSPVDGIIVKEQVETDSYVQRGTPLMTIEDISKAEVSCSLRMDQLYWLLDQNVNSRDRLVNSPMATLQKPPPALSKVRFRLGGRESIVYQWDGRLDRFEGSGLDPQNRMVPLRIVVDRPTEYLVNGVAPAENPLALVRGMFVDVVVQAKPATQLLLVPKLSVKPATDSRRIWKFEPDNRALEVVARRHGLDESASGESVQLEGEKRVRPRLVTDRPPTDRPQKADAQSEKDGDVASTGTRSVTGGSAPLDPDQWQCGFLRVLEGVEVVGVYVDPQGGNEEYLICDVSRTEIQPGDLVVVTPIPGVETMEEPIRVAKSNLIVPSLNSQP